MPREFSRGRRVADLIQRELAILIQMEIKDPRVGMVTVNEVKVSRDLAYAEVYITLLPEDNYQQAIDVLNHASGFLRTRLSKILVTRTTPKLRFHYDDTIENGARISKAINLAIKKDLANHPDQLESGGSSSEKNEG
ncbi:MAG: 30S ribosome-binding factor RbfA [Pseudomonadales bacterium]|nr:30S ribosome-binding factor RbfA [Pseudomonadales bacterium]